MPSVNWREVADNWFGACCCSFGGISEKLVTKYANSYSCAEGTCLVNAASVIVCEDDFTESVLTNCSDGNKKHDHALDLVREDGLTEHLIKSGSYDSRALCRGNQSEEILNINMKLRCVPLKKKSFSANLECEVIDQGNDVDTSFCTSPSIPDFSGEMLPVHRLSIKDQSHCCVDKVSNHDHEVCSHGGSTTCSKVEDQELTKGIELLPNRESLLNGCLGDGFIVRSFNLSKDVEWIEVLCPHCSSILGGYPYVAEGYVPVDGGVRLFKCYVSTGLPVGGSVDIFRKYTLHRMFVNQLLESATDELSFRTVVRDLRTKSLMLQIILLNSNAWSCTGYCLETESIVGPVSKIDLHPVAKVLFSDCSNTTEAQTRVIEEWATRNQADEVYMLTHQIKELIESLKSAQERLPFSCSFLQGLSVSTLDR